VGGDFGWQDDYAAAVCEVGRVDRVMFGAWVVTEMFAVVFTLRFFPAAESRVGHPPRMPSE